MSEPPRVIINADDFGLHPAINEGIERGHRDGLIRSASLMTLGPALDDAVRRTRSLPALDLGLHFTLVGVPGLPSGLGAFFTAYLRGQLPACVLADTLRRQLDIALHTHNLSLSHIDAHQHLHAFPPIMRVVCQVAAEYGIVGIRLPSDGPAHTAVSPARRAQAAALRAMARLSRRYIGAHDLHTTDHFSGMAVSGHLTPKTLAAYLNNAQDGTTEIVCHPGADNAALSAQFAWGYDWEGELAAVCETKAPPSRVRLLSWQELQV